MGVDTVMGVDILCLAVCVCDVMNKAARCGGSVRYIMRWFCSALD